MAVNTELGEQNAGAPESCAPLSSHEHQQEVINRLARVEGHVRGVRRMVEEGRACPAVLIQIAALRSALNGVGRLIVEDHLRGCLVDAVRSGDFEGPYHDLKHALDQFIR